MDYTAQFAASNGAGAEARQGIRDHFRDELEPGRLHELGIVVGELVDNSAKHGPGEPIQVRVALDERGNLRGEVEDGGEGDVAISEMSQRYDSGLGLHIVDALTDRWAVYEGSTHVWFEIGPQPPPRPV